MQDHDRRLRLEALYTQHAAAVYAYARRRADAASAEDVVMEVFVVACRRLEQVPAQPLPWLLGCARRLLANQRRGEQRAEALIDRLANDGMHAISEDATNELVATALAKLSAPDQEILLLSSWEDLEPVEIAEVLGCTRTAAAVRLHRARKRLGAAIRYGDQKLGGQIAEATP